MESLNGLGWKDSYKYLAPIPLQWSGTPVCSKVSSPPRACAYSFSSALWWLQGVLSQLCQEHPQKPGLHGRIWLCHSLLAQTLILSFQLRCKWKVTLTLLSYMASGPFPALGDQGDPSQRADKCHPMLSKGLKALLAHGKSPFSLRHLPVHLSLWLTDPAVPPAHLQNQDLLSSLALCWSSIFTATLNYRKSAWSFNQQMTVALLYVCWVSNY